MEKNIKHFLAGNNKVKVEGIKYKTLLVTNVTNILQYITHNHHNNTFKPPIDKIQTIPGNERN